jgi:hypothetical protein
MMPPRRIGKTPMRHYRADDELYDPALEKARGEGHDLAEVIRALLRGWLHGDLHPRYEEDPPPEVGGETGPGPS